MKSVMCMAPDAAELALSGRGTDTFILDPETYYHFRDHVFVQGIKDYISRTHPGELPPGKVVDGEYHSPPSSMHGVKQEHMSVPADSDAARAAQWFDTRDIIERHYNEWRRQQPQFYAYNDAVYSFVFHGFFNVGNEIELLRWEPEELAASLNQACRHPIRWVLKKLFR